MTRFDLVLKGGHVVDPANGIDAVLDVAILKSRIVAVEPDINPCQAKAFSGKAVIPGIIDPHVHIRNVGHRNMTKMGVVTAVDVSAPMTMFFRVQRPTGQA